MKIKLDEEGVIFTPETKEEFIQLSGIAVQLSEGSSFINGGIKLQAEDIISKLYATLCELPF